MRSVVGAPMPRRRVGTVTGSGRTLSSRLAWIGIAIALFAGLGWPGANPAGAASTSPRVTQFSISPRNLTNTGGTVTLSVSATNAYTCTFNSSIPVTGMPASLPCSGGSASTSITLPGNGLRAPVFYYFTVTAVGTSSVTTSAQRVTVTGTPRPNRTFYAAVPPNVPATGGKVTVTATVTLANTCTYSSRPSLPGLPVTIPCSNGTASVNLTLPPKTGTSTKATYYGIYLTLHGSITWTPAPLYIGVGLPLPPTQGYWTVAADGGVFTYGLASFWGSTGSMHLNQPVVGMAPTPDDLGYWLVAKDGGVFSFGDAPFWGSTGSMHLNSPIVGMAPTPDGLGYWLVAADGGVFSFGDAYFFGSMGGQQLNQPIEGIISTPDGNGYWIVAADGGVFSFGDASFYGSLGGVSLNQPIVGITPSAGGLGSWLAASDGGVFTFGDAPFYGSMGGIPLVAPMVGIAATGDGHGYWTVAADGGVFSFGDANFYGSMGGLPLNAPMVGMAATGSP
ncbi:MAG: hypothetical protein ACLP9C_07870 [Acidimicrobiales bacterium]